MLLFAPVQQCRCIQKGALFKNPTWTFSKSMTFQNLFLFLVSNGYNNNLLFVRRIWEEPLRRETQAEWQHDLICLSLPPGVDFIKGFVPCAHRLRLAPNFRASKKLLKSWAQGAKVGRYGAKPFLKSTPVCQPIGCQHQAAWSMEVYQYHRVFSKPCNIIVWNWKLEIFLKNLINYCFQMIQHNKFIVSYHFIYCIVSFCIVLYGIFRIVFMEPR